MEKPRLAIDFDDVLIRTAPVVMEHYNRTYGTSLQLADNYSADLDLWKAPSLDVVIERIEAFENSEEFCQSVQPTSGAIAAIKELATFYEIHIITSRTPMLNEKTRHLIDKFYGNAITELHLVGISGNETGSKAELCKQLEIDTLVDDSIYNVADAVRTHIRAILFGNYPWNRVSDLPSFISNPSNWSEAKKILLEEI